MSHYRLLAVGENFPIGEGRERKLMGWYATRWVEAGSLEQAAGLALKAFRLELPTSPEARISFEEIEQVEEGDVPATQGGFTFFEMENERD